MRYCERSICSSVLMYVLALSSELVTIAGVLVTSARSPRGIRVTSDCLESLARGGKSKARGFESRNMERILFSHQLSDEVF